jgi:hypothetical protein
MGQRKNSDFKKVQAHWYQKLKNEGFKDIEDTRSEDRLLLTWHSRYFVYKYSSLGFQSKQVYFEMAQDFLNEHPFASDWDIQVWTLHTEGLSIREIARKLDTKRCRVELTIKRLRALMLPERAHGKQN